MKTRHDVSMSKELYALCENQNKNRAFLVMLPCSRVKEKEKDGECRESHTSHCGTPLVSELRSSPRRKR